MKPGNQKQDIYSTSLAEKEKELQIELDILDTKQKIAAINNDENRRDTIVSYDNEITNPQRGNKRDDGIELLIDSSEDTNSDGNKSNKRDESESRSYNNKTENDSNNNKSDSSNDSNLKQIRI